MTTDFPDARASRASWSATVNVLRHSSMETPAATSSPRAAFNSSSSITRAPVKAASCLANVDFPEYGRPVVATTHEGPVAAPVGAAVSVMPSPAESADTVSRKGAEICGQDPKDRSARR